ncbi:unnamed protein product [marine sediment metagenome]|uniref:Uncharacterized protein n=1 Tax=marine sediment metagenome TaxID=412755 RepID=X1AA36_9ZZZZ
MEEPIIELAHKITSEVEKFIVTCKEKSDITIDDVLKRLKSLKEQT